jgi:putative nucleotidyltransferase with HDIG domain
MAARNKEKSNPTQQTFKRLSRLSDISMALSSGMELTDLLKTLGTSIKDALNSDEVYFLLLDKETFELKPSVAMGVRRKRPGVIQCYDRRIILSSEEEFGFAPCPPDKSTEVKSGQPSSEELLMRNAFSSRQRLLYTGEMNDPMFKNSSFHSAIIIPLTTNTRCVGVLSIGNIKKKQSFTINDLEEATVFANLAAMAIEHINLVDERENRIREMEKLNVLAKRFSSVQTLEGLIGLSFEYLSQLIQHDLGVVCLFKDDEETRYFVSRLPLAPGSLDNLSRHINDVSVKIRGKEPRLVRCQQLFLPGQKTLNMDKVFRRKIQSFLTVPLTVQGKNIGLINISSTKKRAFNREHLRTFTTLSNLLATAVENVKIRLYLERRIDEISVLFEISQSITSTLVLDEVLDSIVNFSMEMMNALRCELRLLDDSGTLLEVRASRGLSKSFLASTSIKVGEGIIGNCFLQRLPISVVDARKDPRTKYSNMVKREKLAGLLAVPIIQRGKPIGVITLYTSKPRDFSQDEIDLLSTFASQASIAIENAQLYANMKEQYLSMVMALAAAIEAKDSYTHGHSTKVMEYAVKIALEMGLNDEEVETIRYAGLLHDIGKIGVKDVILSKKELLTCEEVAELHRHPEYGANIMERVELLKDIAPLTLYHHEKFDGTGYPLGLAGNQIPLGARILAVADTYDAMIADRPYRDAFPFAFVKKEMKKVAGTQLDPEIVKIFFEILKKEGVD